MKIKVIEKPYEEVMAMKPFKNRRPERQGVFWRWLLKTLSAPELKKVSFHVEKNGMERLGKDEPALYLMNHSSFIDLKIASTVIYPRPFHIVCTLDGFVGKENLLRKIGCIPTRKFKTDTALVRDMVHTVENLKESILLYPEASYTFDGTATPLPESIGKAVKMLGVPVVMIRTYGAFLRDPLYNNLQIRDVKVTADMEYVLSSEEVKEKSVEDINAIIGKRFEFDNFRIQKEQGIKVTEPFRADHLDRVLYKCPHCMTEGRMKGEGIKLTCMSCGNVYEMTELGEMKALEPADMKVIEPGEGNAVEERLTDKDAAKGESSLEFTHIPDWYAWERSEVRREIEEGIYEMTLDVDIYALVNTDAVYKIGEGTLTHNIEGFHLTGCNGKLDYTQSPEESYSLYSDYYWYEIGDMISIGTPRIQYYCFPKVPASVAKARLAAEELWKISSNKGKE